MFLGRVLVWVSVTASLPLQAAISLCTVHRSACWRSVCIQTQESYKETQSMSIVCILCDICTNLPNQPCLIPIRWIICSFSALHWWDHLPVYSSFLFLFFFFILVLVLFKIFPASMPRSSQHLVKGLMSKATLRERLKGAFPDFDGTRDALSAEYASAPWVCQCNFS